MCPVPGTEQEVAPGVPVRFVRQGTEHEHAGRGGFVLGICSDQPFEDLASARCIVGKDASVVFAIAENHAGTSGYIDTRVTMGGMLRTGKGLSAPGIVRPVELTQKDIDDLRFGAKLGVDVACLSHVTGPEQVEQAREVLARTRRKRLPRVFAKIECAEALERIDSIAATADGIVIGRGDLAAETSPSEVPLAQTVITRAAAGRHKPCLVATGVLDTMRRSSTASFAELRDIHRSIQEGATGFVLTSETGTGRNGALAVSTLVTAARFLETARQPVGQRRKARR